MPGSPLVHRHARLHPRGAARGEPSRHEARGHEQQRGRGQDGRLGRADLEHERRQESPEGQRADDACREAEGDPSTLIAVVLLLLAIAVTACVIPAWAATRIPPASALRAD